MNAILISGGTKSLSPENVKTRKNKPAKEASKVYLKSAEMNEELPGTEEKKIKIRLKSFRRLSPFLFLIGFLCVLVPKIYMENIRDFFSGLVYAILLLIIISNIILADFAIWNYFKGRRIVLIWAIEIVLSFIIIYLLV